MLKTDVTKIKKNIFASVA